MIPSWTRGTSRVVWNGLVEQRGRQSHPKRVWERGATINIYTTCSQLILWCFSRISEAFLYRATNSSGNSCSKISHMFALPWAARNEEYRRGLKILPPKCKGCKIFFTEYPSLWSGRQIGDCVHRNLLLPRTSTVITLHHRPKTDEVFSPFWQTSRGTEVVYKSPLLFMTKSQKSQFQFKIIENNEVQPLIQHLI